MEIAARLEGLSGWGAYREFYLPSSKEPLKQKILQNPPSLCWDLWKNPETKAFMLNAGYAMAKVNGKWVCVRTVKFAAPKTRQRLLQESLAVDSTLNLIKPPGLEYLGFQKGGIEFTINRLYGLNGYTERPGILIADDMGLGKQTEIVTPILTPSGWRKVGDIRVGDEVIDADGMASTVTGVFPQGIKPIYEVEFSDGVKTNCGLEHLWEVRDGNMATRGRGWTVMTLGEMMKRGLKLKSGANKFEIPQFPGHLMTTGEQPKIDGWLLGQLIGNGSTGGPDSQIKVSSNTLDADVIKRLEKHGGIETYSSSEGCAQRRFPIHSAGRLMDELRSLNVACKSKEKSLHPSLLVTPWAYRVELLRGLMDADGSNIKNRITYHTCAPQLAQDVAQLVRSLGGAAVVREYDRPTEEKPTEWQVSIHTQFCPFWSARKSKGWKADWRSRGNKIEAARYLYDAEAVCIMVDHPRHLYVTEGYKLTHNTIQAIGVMNQNPHLREMQILVVCPASLKYNWRNEIRKWVVDGLGSEAFVVKKKWPDALANIVIVNYDTMKKWQEQVREREWDLIVFDEAHLLKNEKAQRTVYSIGGVHTFTKKNDEGEDEKEHIIVTRPNAKKFLFMTGTPMENGRAIEYWNFIKVCDPDGMGRSFAGYRKRYIETDDNYEELQETLRMKMMIRRMKTQVWTDMPEKMRAVVTLDPEEYGVAAIFEKEMSIFREYQEALKTWGLKAEIAKMEDSALYVQIVKNRALNLGMTLGEIAKMRKRGAIAKVPGVLDRIEQLTEGGTPIIVFGHHMEVLDLIQEGAEKLGLRVVRVDGSCSPEARQAAMEAFQNGEADMFLGGIIPAGVGLTLTRATIVLFAELDWIPGRMTQAEDRAHRIGQKNAVLAEQVVMEASLDEYMAKLIIGKQEKIERACDSHRLENMEDMIGLDEDEKEVAKEEAEIDGQGTASKEKQFNELFSTEKASTKGYSLKRLEADAAKVTSEMTDLAKRIAAIAAVSKLGGMDKEICEHVRRAETVTGRHVAMVRRIAMKNKEAFMAQGITRSTIEETFER